MVESESSYPIRELRIEQRHYRQMLEHLSCSLPHEGCGLLAGTMGFVTRVYGVLNQLASPSAFEMDPKQQLEAMIDIEDRGLDLLAIFHSHPVGPEFPSAVDVSAAYYPEAINVIVSFAGAEQPIVKAFYIRDDHMGEIPFVVV
jgi:proteasome lid subunit RPN8/RPN11